MGKEKVKGQVIYRADGRVEWICKHGCGHTISVPKIYRGQKAAWCHGCDGCCSFKENAKEINEAIQRISLND